MFRGCRREDMPPHIFAVGQQAYRSMMTTREDQSLVLMGLSGSGKTFNARYLLRYLSTISQNEYGPVSSGYIVVTVHTRMHVCMYSYVHVCMCACRCQVGCSGAAPPLLWQCVHVPQPPGLALHLPLLPGVRPLRPHVWHLRQGV